MRLKRRQHVPTKESPYPEGSVGLLMEPPVAVFLHTHTIEETIETLRDEVKHAFITYARVVEADGKQDRPRGGDANAKPEDSDRSHVHGP